MFVSGAQQNAKIEAPILLDPDALGVRLREAYPIDLQLRGVNGGVVVSIDVGQRGEVLRARVRASRILGAVPGYRPRVLHPGTSRVVRGLKWSYDPALHRIAEQCIREARFIPGAINGISMPTRGYRLICHFAPEVNFRGDDELGTCVLTP